MPKTPKKPIVPLDPDLATIAKSIWIVGNNPNPRSIADILDERTGNRVDPRAIERAARAGKWENERVLLCEDPAVCASRCAQEKHLSDCRVTVEAGGADCAVLLITAHRSLLRKQAQHAAAAESYGEIAAVSKALGPVAANMTAARLAVGLTTAKEDTAAADALVDLLVAAGAAVETEAEWEAGSASPSAAQSQGPAGPAASPASANSSRGASSGS